MQSILKQKKTGFASRLKESMVFTLETFEKPQRLSQKWQPKSTKELGVPIGHDLELLDIRIHDALKILS